MLCSLSTTSAGKSTVGLSWLDRLRISKGFPLHHPDLDLDHFLLHPSNLPSPLPISLEDVAPTQTHCCSRETTDDQCPPERKLGGIEEEEEEEGEKEKGKFFKLTSNALAELFRMGNPAEYKGIREIKDRRNYRKQHNPKICVIPVSGCDGGGSVAALSPPSVANSTVGEDKRLAGKRTLGKKRAFNGAELEEQSRTEVTVIDTSCSPEWKSQKILFRKGNVWKIRDKISWNLSTTTKKKKTKTKLRSAEMLTKHNEADKNEAVCEDPQEPVKEIVVGGRLHLSRSSHKPAVKEWVEKNWCEIQQLRKETQRLKVILKEKRKKKRKKKREEEEGTDNFKDK